MENSLRADAGNVKPARRTEVVVENYAWVFDASSLNYLGTTEAALLGVGVADKAGEVPSGTS